MKFNDFYLSLLEYAPLDLSKMLCEKDDMYDNSGIIVYPDDEQISGILFTLDLTKESAKFAFENGCNLIVTHHPAIYRPINSIGGQNEALRICAKRGIAVVSTHLNLDCASEGIDYYLAKGLGGQIEKICEPLGEGVGYGRLSQINPITLEGLESVYKKQFQTQKVWLYGDKSTIITKIASFCGAGLDGLAIDFAIKNGAQTVVSADIPHHVLIEALEKGLTVMACTHYATENFGMKKVCDYFTKKYKNEKIYFFNDERFI